MKVTNCQHLDFSYETYEGEKRVYYVVSSDMFKSLSDDGKALCFTTKLLMLQRGVK